jgi:ATP-binding cassette subfamily C protein CydD
MFLNGHLISFARGHRGQLIRTCLLQLLLTLLGTLISLGMALIVRMLQGERRILIFDALWQVFACVALLIAARFLLMRVKAVASEKCGLGIKRSLRKRLLEKLFELGPAYTGRNRTGEIASSISGKVEYLSEYFTMYLPAAASAIVNAVIIIVAIHSLNAATAWLCAAACAGLLGCPMIFYFLMRERGKREMQMHAQYFSDCLDSVQGMTTLKAFNAGARQKQFIHEKGEQLRRAVMGQLRVTMIENVVLQFFAGLGSAFAIALAAWQTANGAMAQEHLVYALFLIGACFAPMTTLISAWHMGYRGVTASYSIEELLGAPVRFSLASHAWTDAPHPFNLEGGIRFDRVGFAYREKDGPVLRDISFSIPHRTTTALVGASGSGKSTIAQLLAGFYPIERGAVSVGNRLLDARSVCAVQDQIAAVWQDCHLFYGTVEENIRIGKPGAAVEEIERAARMASIHDFIVNLPQGYQTQLGEGGLRFSGGERQRVALARAFLRDAPIVVLDEATSSLDRKNELNIQRSLKQLSEGRTALVIAHRLATIQNADQIILMEGGRMRAIGTHRTLLQSSQAYRNLMGNQTTGGSADET